VGRDGRALNIHLSTDLLEYARIIGRRKGYVILAGILGAAVAVLITLPQARVYRAEAAIEIQAPNEDFLFSRDVNPITASNSSYPEIDMLTQVRLLEAGPLMERVIHKLDATPDVQPSPPTSRWAAWRQVLRLPEQKPLTKLDLIAAAASGVHVKASPTSRIVEITCDSTDPKLASAFANTMASEFIDQSLEARWASAQHTGEWLGRQLDELKVKLERSEDQLQRYAKAMNLVFTGDKENANIAEDKLRQLQTELAKVEAERIAKQSRYELASRSPIETVSATLDDETLRTNRDKLTELRRQLAELSSSYTAAHYKVKRAQAQIAELEAEQDRQRDRILARVLAEYEEAARREKLLRLDYDAQAAIVSDQAQKAIHYNVLKREVDTNRQLYESLSQKVKEAGVASAMRASNVRVVDPAQTPQIPVRPQPRRNGVFGMLLGLMAGCVLVLVREKADRSISVPGETVSYLGVRELGTIPNESVLDGGTGFMGRLRRQGGDSKDASLETIREGSQMNALERVTFERSNSILAESFRATLTSLVATYPQSGLGHVFVISSPTASDGKTTIAANLAMAFAEIKRRVLIVDADTRRPRLHRIFSVSREPGLLDILRNKHSTPDLEGMIVPTDIPGLFLLPSGKRELVTANPLYSPWLKDLIEKSRRMFDAVIVDTPPILHLSDARVIGTHSDGVVLVIRSRSTTRDAAIAAKRSLVDDGIRLIGTVLNDWNPRLTGYYGYESYRNYSRSYVESEQ